MTVQIRRGSSLCIIVAAIRRSDLVSLMPLRNACFISFRHGQHELTQRFVSEFHDGLCSELETYLGGGVTAFLDQDRLQGGDLFNEAIAQHLWESSCLVMVYTPSYFDLTHTYCAREYKAMEGLEQTRLPLLGDGIDRTHGLIIPVIFRGGRHLPSEIRDSRHCYDFSEFLLTDQPLSKHAKYAGALRQMAEYIAERYRALSAAVRDDCGNFRLPPATNIRDWLEEVVYTPMPLPGRVDEN